MAPYAEYYFDSEYHLVLIKIKSIQYTLSPQEIHRTWKPTQLGLLNPLLLLNACLIRSGWGKVGINEDNAQNAISV